MNKSIPYAITMFEWHPAIAQLPAEYAGKLFKSLNAYVFSDGENDIFTDALAEARENINKNLQEGIITVDEWLTDTDMVNLLDEQWRIMRDMSNHNIETYYNRCKGRASREAKRTDKPATVKPVEEKIVVKPAKDPQAFERPTETAKVIKGPFNL